ncbi:MAG: homoserine dehydrogenase [Acidobacteriota bacterium]
MPPDLAIVLIGFGNVTRRFVRLLDEVADRLDFGWRLVAIATRHHGSVVDPEGIDATRAAALVEAAQSLDRLDPSPRERSGIDVIRQVADALADEAGDGHVVVVEATTLDIDRGEPAVSHVRASLESLAHVVTVNKGPAAFAYADLEALADSQDRVFFFEGAVMDGAPVFNLVRESMPAVDISGFRGVINTTCQYVLHEIERGVDMDDAIQDMQARGIAEADPSHDIDGWDGAAKTAALVNVLMGGGITPHDVSRMGIGDISPREMTEAMARGRRIRLVASAARHGGRLDARVEPELLDPGDPLAALGPTENALFLHTDLLGDIGIVQRTSSLTQTAYALLSDVTAISRRLQELSPAHQGRTRPRSGRR